MQETESQIVKIQLGTPKQTNRFTYVHAEKALGSDAEIYIVIGLPVINPSNINSYEAICDVILQCLKKAYKNQVEKNSFENAITEINEELGKIVGSGNTEWIDKLHAIIAVKSENHFYLSSSGKVSSYLLREGQFSDISCSGDSNHPLKTFETFASGKIRLGDILVLSTTQLFSYLSMDKFKQIVTTTDFAEAGKEIIRTLKENSDEKESFGTILNLQVEPGQTPDEEIDLESYISKQEKQNIFSYFAPIYKFFSLQKLKNLSSSFKTKIATQNLKVEDISNSAKYLLNKTKALGSGVKDITQSQTRNFSLTTFKNFSLAKKLFFVSLFLVFLVLILNISLTIHYKKQKVENESITKNLTNAEILLSKASDSFLYKDEQSAKNFFSEALTKLPKEGSSLNKENHDLYQKIKPLVEELRIKVDKNLNTDIKTLANLPTSSVLISLPEGFGTQIENTITSYNLNTGKTLDSAYKLNAKINLITPISDKQSVILWEKGLSIWAPGEENISSNLTRNISEIQNLSAIAYYSENKKAYLLDKNLGTINSFLISPKNIGQAVLSVQNPDLKNAQSITIDGNIYVLTENEILKFNKGEKQKFNMPSLTEPFSGKGKIYTEKSFSYLYLMDISKRRILVLDKEGSLILSIYNKNLNSMNDFKVDEKNKTIYILNDTSLIKINF